MGVSLCHELNSYRVYLSWQGSLKFAVYIGVQHVVFMHKSCKRYYDEVHGQVNIIHFLL